MKNLILISGIFLISAFSAQAKVNSDSKLLEQYEKQLTQCINDYVDKNNECTEIGTEKCDLNTISALTKSRDCHKKLATEILTRFYNRSPEQSAQKIDDFISFLFEEYSFIYKDTDFCHKNKCGILADVNVQYAVTTDLSDYVFRLIQSFSSGI